MKLFITIFAAIMAAAIVISSASWAQTRVVAWGAAWRECAIQAHTAAANYIPFNAPDTPPGAAIEGFKLWRDEAAAQEMKQSEVTRDSDKRRGDAAALVEKLERQAIAILEHKPFGLPLTASERQELNALKQDVEKAAATRKALTQ
jgi:hypothetical protein